MAKKREDNWSVDEWDESLETGKINKAPDPFYGPLTSTPQAQDDDWGLSTGTDSVKKQTKSQVTHTAGRPSKRLVIVLSFAAAMVLMAGGIYLLTGKKPDESGKISGLATTSTITQKPETPVPDTPDPSTPKPVTPEPVTPEPVTTKPTTPEPVSSLSDNEWYGTEFRYYYQQLTSHEQEVFEQIYDGIVNHKKKISISPCSQQEFDHVFTVLIMDCPEFFHIEGGTHWGYTQRITDYEPDYRIDQAAYLSTCAQIHQVIDQIKAELPAVAGDYEKTKAVHYWMIDHCEYLAAGDDSTAYADACLLYGRSQCSGYAAAQSLLLRALGVNCLKVYSETHAWNIVRINSRWYQNDATWDDLDYPWEKDGNRYAAWFNIPDKLVKDINHQQKTQPGFTVPVCNSLQDNYSYREGIYIQAGTSDTAGYIANSLKKAHAAGKHSVDILIDDPSICARWDTVLDQIYNKNNLYDWVFYPPGDTQTAYAIYSPK